MQAAAEPESESISAPPAAPNAPAVDQPLPCPLCDYDLRGLTEPRCPECGFRFDWRDLTDPDRKRHPYLFEHHPRRNVWSFVRTMLGGLRPRHFWRSLKPSQPSRPRRMVLYWLIATLLLPVSFATVVASECLNRAREHEALRQNQLLMLQQHPPGGRLRTEIADAGGPQAFVDRFIPPVWTPAYVRYTYRIYFQHRAQQNLEVALVMAAWPWLTLATLMIFRASMQRAKARPVHVLRCALYCGDATLWLGLLALFALPPAIQRLDLNRYTAYHDALVAAPLAALFTSWRLSAACRHYLHFHHPAATALAAQAVVLLGVWAWVLGFATSGVQ
jgi:hypothetical protein